MDFDFERFRELLEFEDDFIKNEKFKNEKSLLLNNREKYYDLALAKIRIEDQIFWCERYQYLDLLKSYRLGEINPRTLYTKWNILVTECFIRYSKVIDLAQNSDSTAHQAELEKLFQNLGDSSSEGFSTLVSQLFGCNFNYPNSKLNFPFYHYAIDSTKTFSKIVRKKISQLQPYLI